MPSYSGNIQSGAAGAVTSTLAFQRQVPAWPKLGAPVNRSQTYPFAVAGAIVEEHHYLHSLAGGTKLPLASSLPIACWVP